MPNNEPIHEFDEEGKAATPGPGLSNKKSRLPGVSTRRPNLVQIPLDLGIEVERTIGGIEMGVLQNGISYLTPTGLEEAAGIPPSTVSDLSQEWEAAMSDEVFPRGSRIAFLRNYFTENGYTDPHLHIEIIRSTSLHTVYPDIVCMAFLEYFAFETLQKNATAVENYRIFSRLGFQEFVYEALPYSPPDKWKYLHDRISRQNGVAPEDYFNVLNEVSGMIIELINAGLLINEKTVPDLGVERGWSDHWLKSYFDDVYGARITDTSNPRLPWAYPNEALAEFRRWFRHDYLTTRFPRYILTRARLLGDPGKTKPLGSLYDQAIKEPAAKPLKSRKAEGSRQRARRTIKPV